jgi:hypothetical protein
MPLSSGGFNEVDENSREWMHGGPHVSTDSGKTECTRCGPSTAAGPRVARPTWAAGDHAAVAQVIDEVRPRGLVNRLQITPGQDVLDVGAAAALQWRAG